MSRAINSFETLVLPANNDLLIIVDVPTSGTANTKNITLTSLFGGIPCNTTITGVLTSQANVSLANGEFVLTPDRLTLTANLSFTGTVVAPIVSTSNISITDSNSGVILKAPNGNSFIVKVDNAGSLTVTSV